MNDTPPLSNRPIFSSLTAAIWAWLSSLNIDHLYKLLLLAGACVALGYSIWKWATEWRDRRARRRACKSCRYAKEAS